ncbi:F-actin capping protein, alpha subunit [Basidiobolus meristosporus CBS 931.73]|uniref:F-actin-capping protein subunit alpha n=1 Tax=Basidiobolus meristosporus CBS 931.73 TaxID=1314790 RepID=A0A1Y1Y1F8_9FUNG|nr:F-actin capping protein, alpha subunit [Basidiobolus meristosporus CBS 931.73]|eukprot:ORX91851.1 F-actin capping protein, alpha subunit [Basidiobolus meristosporus CBS 931.73]
MSYNEVDETELNIEQKIKIASGFLLASPPGEVNDVFNDIRSLIDDDEVLVEGIIDTLREYNTEQFVTVALPEQEQEVVVCKAGEVDEVHYLDPRSKQVFKFDHLRQTVADLEEHTPDEEMEPFRAALEEAVDAYCADHYPNGTASVFTSGRVLTIVVVDNKYNQANFWNGRWRSLWTLDLDSNELKGSLKVQVHYFEDGNVQLNSSKDVTIEINAGSNPGLIANLAIKKITKAESEFQEGMNNGYNQLSDSTFKGLRRTLPVTRSKIDWDKMMNYKIGSELASK